MTVAALARLAGLSRAPFARRFESAMGTPPLRFLTELRLRNAATRLVATDARLAEIAVENGYATEFSFAKAFKRAYGIAPGVFRKRAWTTTAAFTPRCGSLRGVSSGSGQTLRAYLREGPFSLAMSSGFFAFFAHTGFLTVLEDEGLLPARVSGSSAGALVTAAWAAGLDAPDLARDLEQLERRDFWDPGLGAGLLRGRLFQERLERLLPTRSFAATRVPAAVSVFDVRTRRTRVLDTGDVASAIRASCAVPLLFHPVSIAGRAYLDGGILDRPGLMGMPEREPRVLFHHIASKSAWRTKLEVPRREGMVTVMLEDLPRSGPFKLAEGRRAFHAARTAMRRALDEPIEDRVVIARA